MMKRITALIMAFAILATLPASAGQLVKEFKGTANTTTESFRVEGPWILDWRVDMDWEVVVALDISLIEATSGRYIGRVLHTEHKGNGVRLLQDSGNFKLRISSTHARWQIKIKQLTEEEAERYTPIEKPNQNPFFN